MWSDRCWGKNFVKRELRAAISETAEKTDLLTRTVLRPQRGSFSEDFVLIFPKKV